MTIEEVIHRAVVFRMTIEIEYCTKRGNMIAEKHQRVQNESGNDAMLDEVKGDKITIAFRNSIVSDQQWLKNQERKH